MALCSRALAKRPGVFSHESPAVNYLKRRRTASINPTFASNFPCTPNSASSSSSEEDLDSENEQSGYDIQQARARRRASTRKLFTSDNSDICRACSLYSDEEDGDSSRSTFSPSVASTGTGTGTSANTNTCTKPPHHAHRYSLSAVPSFAAPLSPPHSRLAESGKDSIVSSPSSALSLQAAKQDKLARARCFDYLVGSIDEAWARYCNATSDWEDLAFGCDASALMKHKAGNNAAPLAKHKFEDDDDDDDDDAYLSGTSNGTELTDYETEPYLHHNPQKPIQNRPLCRDRVMLLRPIPLGACASSPISSSSSQLQALKDRLTKAKYFLQDLVDSDHSADVECFWKRWDMIKYATIELVEDDDDDEVVESSIEDLEKGRVF